MVEQARSSVDNVPATENVQEDIRHEEEGRGSGRKGDMSSSLLKALLTMCHPVAMLLQESLDNVDRNAH